MTRSLILVLIFFISLSGLFGYASYSLYGEKQLIKESLDRSEANAALLSSSLLKAENALLLSESIAAEYIFEAQDIIVTTQDVVNKIDEIELSEDKKNEEIVYVSVSGRLSPSVVSLLTEACLSAKGNSCNNPK